MTANLVSNNNGAPQKTSVNLFEMIDPHTKKFDLEELLQMRSQKKFQKRNDVTTD
jgi:hypothetical protein